MKFSASKLRLPEPNDSRVATAAFVAIGLALLLSRIGFSPIPWPDASAFYLPGVDLVASLLHGSPEWQMRSQAAFIPSYREANFNTMPALPILLGLLEYLGLSALVSATLMTRLVSILALVGLASFLFRWLRDSASQNRSRSRVPIVFAWLVPLALLFDPSSRWGALVVRTEIWVALAWAYLLFELQREERKRSEIRIAAALAIGAYFHFEAIVLVPGTAVALLALSGRDRMRRSILALAKVAGWTLLFLSPWLLYVAFNFSQFANQMSVQFERVAEVNQSVTDFYSFFHGFFSALGTPGGWPKIFNPGKGAIWLLILLLTFWTGTQLFAPKGKEARGLILAPALGFYAALYLWLTKPEAWFVSLAHYSLWIWLAFFAARTNFEKLTRVRVWALGLASLSLVFGILAALTQQLKMDPGYTWKNYSSWVACLDASLTKRGAAKVWQPFLPDALVDLRHKNRSRELTRSRDFKIEGEGQEKIFMDIEAILISWFVPTAGSRAAAHYSGPLRAMDRDLLRNKYLEGMGHMPLENPSRAAVCQRGPFWGVNYYL